MPGAELQRDPRAVLIPGAGNNRHKPFALQVLAAPRVIPIKGPLTRAVLRQEGDPNGAR